MSTVTNMETMRIFEVTFKFNKESVLKQ